MAIGGGDIFDNNKPQKEKLDESSNILGEGWKMHDQDIAKLGEGWTMLDDGIVTTTMLETCKWKHNKTTKALGITP
jgi:hypothetical protein